MKQTSYICQVRFFILFLAAFSFLAFDKQKTVKQFQLSGFAQGTTYSITYYAIDSLLTKTEVEYIFNSLDSSLSIYKPYSLINAFNQSPEGMLIDKHLKKVVSTALRIHTTTNGAFDITVWPLVNAWGFGTQKIHTPPTAALIDSLMACIGSNKLQLAGEFLRKQMPCISIDVNGIAQGYSADVFASLLELKGIQNYMVEIGGEIRMKGRKQPGNEQMKIGLEMPGNTPFDPMLVRRILTPDSGAITTSGSYLKFYESNGKHITHIIDPRTGLSIQNELVSVTVFARDAITADGYDNALMVMGLEKAFQFAASHTEIEAYFIYRTKEGGISDTATTRFYNIMSK